MILKDDYFELVLILAASRKWKTREPEMIQNTNNPIRKIVDQIKIVPNEKYEMIPLSIGDPSKFGNYDPPQVALDAVVEAIKGV